MLQEQARWTWDDLRRLGLRPTLTKKQAAPARTPWPCRTDAVGVTADVLSSLTGSPIAAV